MIIVERSFIFFTFDPNYCKKVKMSYKKYMIQSSSMMVSISDNKAQNTVKHLLFNFY